MNLTNQERRTLSMIGRNHFLTLEEMLRAGVPEDTVHMLAERKLIELRTGAYRLTEAGKGERG